MKLKQLIVGSKVKIGEVECIVLEQGRNETLLHDTVSGELFQVNNNFEVVKE